MKKLRDKSIQALLRQIAKFAPQTDPINRQVLYRLLLVSRRFIQMVLDPSRSQSIRLFLRQNTIVFDCSAFGIINCGQTFDYKRSLLLIKLYEPQNLELVLIGKNLLPNDLRTFLMKLKQLSPSFTTTSHRHLARAVQLQQSTLLETMADKLKRVELFENQLPYLHRSNNILDKCVVICKSSLGQGQLALALKTKTRCLVGRYQIQEFLTCKQCTVQPTIEDLQLINNDMAWRFCCSEDNHTFFDFISSKLPNLKQIVFGMSERLLLKEGQRWTNNCAEDLVLQVANFKRHSFLNSNHDLREHCRTQIQNTQKYAQQVGIKIFLCYETESMRIIHKTPKLYPLDID